MSKQIIFTFGHSNRTFFEFIGILKNNGISIIIDVRTKPYSRYCPHFNKNALQRELANENIQYLWRGNNLGGMGVNTKYSESINEVIQLAETATVCILCSEKNYTACHRHLTLEPSFNKAGAIVKH